MTNSALWDDAQYEVPPDPDREPRSDDYLGVLALVCVALMMIAWLLTQMGVF